MVMSDNKMHGNMGTRKSLGNELDPTAASTMQSLINVMDGQVTAIHQGLLNVGIRIRIGQQTDLRVRWPLGATLQKNLVNGSPVKAVIPMEAVHLESGYFRLGKRRWNRWIGQVTSVEAAQNRRIVSVTLHNDPLTLTCCGSMTGLNWVPQVGDTVNIVVDPTEISLDAGTGRADRPLRCRGHGSPSRRTGLVKSTGDGYRGSPGGYVAFTGHRDRAGFRIHRSRRRSCRSVEPRHEARHSRWPA